MQHPFVLFILLFLGTVCYGQQKRIVIDNRMPTSSIHPNTDIHVLAKKITKGLYLPEAKSRAIYQWIGAHISYDYELRVSKKLQQKIYVSEKMIIRQALLRRKAVCSGYAYLFQKLCLEVGIRAEVIDGWTGKTNSQGDTPVNHTWNAVFLDGEWQLLDLNWAISHGTTKRLNDFWYLTPPHEFGKSHTPENTAWFLLKQPL